MEPEVVLLTDEENDEVPSTKLVNDPGDQKVEDNDCDDLMLTDAEEVLIEEDGIKACNEDQDGKVCIKSEPKVDMVEPEPNSLLITGASVKGYQLTQEIVKIITKLLSGDDRKLVRKIKEIIQNTHPTYLSSHSFHKIAQQFKIKSKRKPQNVLFYLKQVVQRLLRYPLDGNPQSLKKLRKTRNNRFKPVKKAKIPCDSRYNITNDIKKLADMPIPESAVRLHSIDLVRYDAATRKNILRLELLLKTLHEKLQDIYNHEVGSDTEDDEEVCLWEERLEKRIMMVWKKLCRLTKRKVSMGRFIDRKILFQGSRYNEINDAVEKFLSRKRIFPDYGNILSIVEQTNITHQLQLQKGEQESIAREVFASVGSLLKKNRIKDFVDLFGCKLTDEPWENDPAMDDAELQQKLQKNKIIGDMKLNEVLKHYADQQVLSKLVPEEVPDEMADLSEGDEESGNGDEEDYFEVELDSSLNDKRPCNNSEDHCESEDLINSMDFSANPPTLKDGSDVSDSDSSVTLGSDDDSKHNLSLSCEPSPSLLVDDLEIEEIDCDTKNTRKLIELPSIISDMPEVTVSVVVQDNHPKEVKTVDVMECKASNITRDNGACDVIVIDSDDSE